jgi:glutaminase
MKSKKETILAPHLAPTSLQPFLKVVVEEIYNSLKNVKGGKNVDYIPELAKVDPTLFAISIFTVDGQIINVGDFKHEFAFESCAKVFTLALALEKLGSKVLKNKIGEKSSQKAFNSICAADEDEGHTINSFNNYGALATLSLLQNNKVSEKALEKLVINNMSAFAGEKLKVSNKIFTSEFSHADHNFALAYLLKSHNRFYGDINTTLEVYTKQCSVMVTSANVALMAATLANSGVNPKTGKHLVSKETCKYILDHMLIAGLYNETSSWIDKTGLHAKSGVGGILLIVVPGKMGIGIISPPLNKYGNSYKGIKAAQKIKSLIL